MACLVTDAISVHMFLFPPTHTTLGGGGVDLNYAQFQLLICQLVALLVSIKEAESSFS